MKIRITKEFHFEMSHCLNNYDGLCKNIHGHSYKLFITLLGTPNTDVNDSGYGMVMDFTKLKKIVTEQILDDFDHSIVIEKHSPYIEAIKNIDTRKNIVDFQPTCENLVIYFKERIEKCLPKNVSLYKVVLFETMTSQAEWNIEDNK
ncbi:MAG: 6-carboxytetrahydropterin synthase [Bacteroidales bacterium]|jgi:6-pyruvoyltetrahydropterin/6-carboxytetrahydropterin synthase|nr:6-carboxytetrahydropterin synthase [Bacteroidales bacterium]